MLYQSGVTLGRSSFSRSEKLEIIKSALIDSGSNNSAIRVEVIDWMVGGPSGDRLSQQESLVMERGRQCSETE